MVIDSRKKVKEERGKKKGVRKVGLEEGKRAEK
jgi:hypothetical protein